MIRKSGNKREFCVVQFIELPFEGIDDYVCVPYTWLIVRKATDQRATVAYPKDEDPFDTRDRVKRKERYNDEWRCYMAIVKYESNSYSDAELWIATRNDYGPLVEKESKVTDKQPKLPVNKKPRSANQNHLSKSNDNCRKSLPKTSIKRRAQSELKKELDGKRLKLEEAAHSSNAVVSDVQVPRLSVAPSKETFNDTQETCTNDFSNNKPPSHQLLNSLKNTANLCRQNNIAQRLVPTQKTVEKRIQPMEIERTVATPSQNFSTIHNNYLLNNQQFQASPNESVLVNEPDECMIDETLSPYHAVTSDSDVVSDQEVISDHEMSTNEASTETTNDVNGTANRPTATQNSTSTNHQMHPNIILEQQMLDNFAALFTQMRSTLRYTTDMYNTLRSSIHDTAETYRKLLGAVEQFNTLRNAASKASPSINLRPEGPRSPEERHTKATAGASSSNQDQHSKDVANKTPKKKHKLYRLVLPPEYDANDSRWTLKYRTNLPGLVELIPQSGVYVSCADLNYCQQVSKDCKSLALRLLSQVFNRNALSTCSSMSETAQASNNVGSNIRPDLDDHACSVLLDFVLEHGLQRGWNTDLQPILSTLHSKMQEIRSKYGVMVLC